jgi:hypothetical protein
MELSMFEVEKGAKEKNRRVFFLISQKRKQRIVEKLKLEKIYF